MALSGNEQEEEDYGERFVDFWTPRPQPNCSQPKYLDLYSGKEQQQPVVFPVWKYPNPVMDKRCNHELLDLNDEQKDLLLEDYPCDHVHNKVMQFPGLPDTWAPSYSEDVFSQEYLLAAQKLREQARQQPTTTAVAGERAGSHLAAPRGVHDEPKCTSDSHVLVSTISNLSKVLLSHYSTPASASASASANELQLALFNLSKCLLRVHGTDDDEQVEATENAAAAGNECRSPETESSGLDEAAEDDIVARLEVLMGLENDRRARKGSDQTFLDHTQSKQQQEEGSYLDLNQVEQRLGMLKSRSAVASEAGTAAIISGEQIDEEYVRQSADQIVDREGVLFEPDDAAAPAAAAAAASVEKVLQSDSGEESWEHV